MSKGQFTERDAARLTRRAIAKAQAALLAVQESRVHWEDLDTCIAHACSSIPAMPPALAKLAEDLDELYPLRSRRT